MNKNSETAVRNQRKRRKLKRYVKDLLIVSLIAIGIVIGHWLGIIEIRFGYPEELYGENAGCTEELKTTEQSEVDVNPEAPKKPQVSQSIEEVLKPEEDSKKPEVDEGIENSEESEKTEEPEEPEEPEEQEQPTIPAQLSPFCPSDSYYYDISEEEKIMIAKVVYREARGEPFEGQVAVAAVVLNRYFHGEAFREFDRRSIKAVVTQKNQFADISVVTMEMLAKYPLCEEAVEAACRGWDPTRILFPDGAFFFYSLNGLSDYQAGLRVGLQTLNIKVHYFHDTFDKMESGKKCMTYDAFKEKITYTYEDYKANSGS